MPYREYAAYDDQHLLTLMGRDDKRAFDFLYERHFDKLFGYVYNRVHCKEDAEEIVQNVFYSFWTKRFSLLINISVSAYLYGACKNLIIRGMRDEKVRRTYLDQLNYITHQAVDNSNEELIRLHDVELTIERSLLGLSSRCQEIFKLSRHQNRSIKEIAQELNISQKTVENQLTAALKHLRVSLGEFMSVIFALLSGLMS